jgi:hypothetical protein
LRKRTDFKCLEYYVRHGRAAPKDPLSSIFESLHDNSITQATLKYLSRQQKVAAIMGGHDGPRNSPTYAAIARISAALCRAALLMASGGGPGAMEATHLGAYFQSEPDALASATEQLKEREPSLPADAGNVITPDGKVDDTILRALQAWIMPAFTLSQTLDRAGESPAVPRGITVMNLRHHSLRTSASISRTAFGKTTSSRSLRTASFSSRARPARCRRFFRTASETITGRRPILSARWCSSARNTGRKRFRP